MSEVLRGVRVVELASWTYVPSAGAALADWGADVIKVEPVQGGDPGRALVVGGFTKEAARAKIDFILEIGNRGKRSIAIDLRQPIALHAEPVDGDTHPLAAPVLAFWGRAAGGGRAVRFAGPHY